MKRLFIFSAVTFISALFCQFTGAQETALTKETQTLTLGDSIVRVNIYKRKGARVTFIAPHYNEQIAIKTAREAVEKNGGRLVEIESFDESGNAQRRINFTYKGAAYSLDPNRIFTENGRACANFAPEIELLVKSFAESLLKILLADGTHLRDGERFLVAVHNNKDVDERFEFAEKSNDLTAIAYSRQFASLSSSRGDYQFQIEGVYLSNEEYDPDNFIFLSTPALMGFFAAEGFNVVVQKSQAKLQIKNCSIDDGSLSVYAGQRNIPYINLETDSKFGEFRQRQMINAVYRVFFDSQKGEPAAKLKD